MRSKVQYFFEQTLHNIRYYYSILGFFSFYILSRHDIDYAYNPIFLYIKYIIILFMFVFTLLVTNKDVEHPMIKYYNIAFDVCNIYNKIFNQYIINMIYMSDYFFYDYIITNPDIIPEHIYSMVPGQVNFAFIMSLMTKLILFPLLSSMTAFNIFYTLISISFIHYLSLVTPNDAWVIRIIILFATILLIINILYYRWNNFMDQVDKSEENMMSIIHDMKNPLIACEYIIEAYAEGKDDPELHEFLNKLKGEIREAFSFTENYRFFYKETKSNEVNEKEESLNINETLNSIMISNTNNCRNNQNKLSIHRRIKEPETIQTKPTIFKRIINNLVSNALKHCQGKEVKLEITKYDDYNDMCNENSIEIDSISDNIDKTDKTLFALEVTDNGQGIPIEKQNKIFESRETSNTEENFDGTGIGLSVAKFLATKLNGGIIFYSKPDLETKFIFYFWVPSKISITDSNLSITDSKYNKKLFEIDYICKPIIIKPHECYPVFIAEDNHVIRNFYNRMCLKLNINSEAFSNGLKIYEYLEEYKKTECCHKCNNNVLILSDYQMPKMNGLQVYDYIKSDEVLSNIVTFYLVSADEFDKSIEVDTITKPLKKNKLKEVYDNFRLK